MSSEYEKRLDLGEALVKVHPILTPKRLPPTSTSPSTGLKPPVVFLLHLQKVRGAQAAASSHPVARWQRWPPRRVPPRLFQAQTRRRSGNDCNRLCSSDSELSTPSFQPAHSGRFPSNRDFSSTLLFFLLPPLLY